MSSTTTTHRMSNAEHDTPRAAADAKADAARVRQRPTSPRVAAAEIAAALQAGASDAELARRIHIAALGTGLLNEHESADDLDDAKIAAIALVSQRGQISVRELHDELGYLGWAPHVALESLCQAGVLDRLEFVTDGRWAARYVLAASRPNASAA